MKRAVVSAAIVLLAAACSSSGGGSSSSPVVAGHGAISISVEPNPVVAHQVSGDTFDIPFDVVVRETGGRAVDINRVSAEVLALGGIPVTSESYDAAKIRSLGFSTHVNPNGELRYHFAPRRSVDERVFGNVSAELTVDGTDETGLAVTARTNVRITK